MPLIPPRLPAPDDAPTGGPVSEADFHRLALAAGHWRKVRSASRLAAFNALSLAIVGGFALLAAFVQILAGLTRGHIALSAFAGLLLGGGLLAIAAIEQRGRSRLLQLDPAGGTLLAWNQVALLAVVVLWCGGKLAAALAGPNPYESVIRDNPQIAPMLQPIIDAYATMTVIVYATAIAISTLFQSYCARLYFAAARQVAATIAATDPWIVRVLRLAA